MALAKNKNKDTVVGQRAKARGQNAEVWVRRGSSSTSSNGSGRNTGGGFHSIRAAARRGRTPVSTRVPPVPGR